MRVCSSSSAVLFAALVASGCAVHIAVPPPPRVLLLPVSFETNLITARECEYRGIVADIGEADRAGANLVLAFTYSRSNSSQVIASNDGSQSSVWISTASEMRGKAVQCPKEALDRILATNRREEASR